MAARAESEPGGHRVTAHASRREIAGWQGTHRGLERGGAAQGSGGGESAEAGGAERLAGREEEPDRARGLGLERGLGVVRTAEDRRTD